MEENAGEPKPVAEADAGPKIENDRPAEAGRGKAPAAVRSTSAAAATPGAGSAGTITGPAPAAALPRILSMLGVSALPVAYCLCSVLLAVIMKPQDQPCQSAVCAAAANYVKSSISLRGQQCSDFYDYVCRGWEANYTGDADSKVTLVNLTAYFTDEANDPSNMVNAKEFLQLCLNAGAAGDDSVDKIIEFLKNDLRFHLPDTLTRVTTPELYRVIVEVQMYYYIHPFFSLSFDSGMTGLTVSTLGRYKPWYLQDGNTASTAFRSELITDVFKLVFPTLSINPATSVTIIEDLLNGIQTKEGEALVVRLRVLSQQQFAGAWELINALGNFLRPEQKRMLDRKGSVRIPNIVDFTKTLSIINDATQLNALASYITWVVVETLGRRTSPKLRKAMEDTSVVQKATNISDYVFRKDWCYYETYRVFALVLDRHLYSNFDRSTLERYEVVVDRVKRVVQALLEELYWMDKITLRAMQQRIRRFVGEVGILSRFRYKDVEGPYSQLPKVNKYGSFVPQYLSLYRTLNQHLSEAAYRNVYPPDVWSITPTVRYIPSYKVLFVPLSLLMKPLFSDGNFPLSLIYGRLVVQVAYAIYYEGYHSHKYGPVETWNFGTERKFAIYMTCFNNGFNNLTSDMEDPAQAFFRSGALRKAYQVLQADMYKHGDNFALPSSELTPAQLFFVASCIDMCTRNQAERQQNKALCNLPMKRTKVFQQAFKCVPSDPLNHLQLHCSEFSSVIRSQFDVSLEGRLR
ncbi:endothelin-converting enzyme 2-like [Haemaphysalis longicornis]